MTYIDDLIDKKEINYWNLNKNQLSYRKRIIEENAPYLNASGVNTVYHITEINEKLAEIKNIGG